MRFDVIHDIHDIPLLAHRAPTDRLGVEPGRAPGIEAPGQRVATLAGEVRA